MSRSASAPGLHNLQTPAGASAREPGSLLAATCSRCQDAQRPLMLRVLPGEAGLGCQCRGGDCWMPISASTCS